MSAILEAPQLQARRNWSRVTRSEILAYYAAIVEYAYKIRELSSQYRKLPDFYVLEIDPTNSTIAEIKKHAVELLHSANEVAESVRKESTRKESVRTFDDADYSIENTYATKSQGPILVARNKKRPTKKEALDFYERAVTFADSVLDAYATVSHTQPKLPFVSNIGSQTVKHILDDTFVLVRSTHRAADRLQKIHARTASRKTQIAGPKTTIEVVKKKPYVDQKPLISGLRDQVETLAEQNKTLLSLAKEIYGVIIGDGSYSDLRCMRQELTKAGVSSSELDKIAACYESSDVPLLGNGKEKKGGKVSLEKMEKKLAKLVRNPLTFCAAVVALIERENQWECDDAERVAHASKIVKKFMDGGLDWDGIYDSPYSRLWGVFNELGYFAASLKDPNKKRLSQDENLKKLIRKLPKFLFGDRKRFAIALGNATSHGEAFEGKVLLDDDDYFLQYWHRKIDSLK